MIIRDGLRIEQMGGRDWVVRNDADEYLGVVTEFGGVEPYYCASIDRFPSVGKLPRYTTLFSAINRFAQ